MTAEITALREQLEIQHRSTSYKSPKRIFRLLLGFLWGAFKHVAIDFILLALALLWLRRRPERNGLKTAPQAEGGRIERAIRVLIGNAMTQLRKFDGGKTHAGHILASSE